ncbi:MAG: DUF427 domain-containing protein [Actinomycetia bacterium]|nr:DUF427 domain-containing protein [Actinomycetes bacterium]MCP4087349.1 DUF427 domain-containing protein [Actinomycetes bacterium]
MPRAVLEGTVLAESDQTVIVEGNHYFPPEAVNQEFLSSSELETSCPWKGIASYYSVTIDGQSWDDVAWYYRDPKGAAAEIRDHVAFYPAVNVEA